MKEWGGRPADGVGRIFRQVMFSSSEDGGKTWAMMRPFFDARGEPVIIQQETNGQLVPLGDGRIALVHQRRFGPFQIIVRFSIDHGKTWLHEEYRLSKGFGFTTNVLLDDGTIVTATGQSIRGQQDHQVSVIRWKPPSREELLATARISGEPLAPPVNATENGVSWIGAGPLDSGQIDVTQYHTYKLRLTRADPKQLSSKDLVEVFIDDKIIGEVHRRQLPGDGYRKLAFGDNDSSSPQEIASNVRYQRVLFVPGEDTSASETLTYSAAAADPSPQSQGWEKVDSGNGCRAHVERDGSAPAWHIASPRRGKILYERSIDPSLYADPRGWTLVVRCRVVDRTNSGSCNIFVRDDRNTIGLTLAR
jgi:hypothetical protein